MADNEKKGGHYEMTLENRHLLGVFFAVVLLCAIFFTLGFVLGRNQMAAKAPASPAQKPPAQAPTASPGPDDLSFYQRVEGKPPAEPVPATKPAESKPTAAKPAAPKPATPTPAKTAPAPAKPAAPAETYYLQVAAVTQEAEAQRLVGDLKKQGFSSVIIPPSADHFYRVQVGPLGSLELADAAQRRLETQGFRQILRIKR